MRGAIAEFSVMIRRAITSAATFIAATLSLSSVWAQTPTPGSAAQPPTQKWYFKTPEEAAKTAPAQKWHFKDNPHVGEPLVVPSVDCAGMESRLSSAFRDHEANCMGQRYRRQLQYCLTAVNQVIAAAEALLAQTKTCTGWTAAQLRKDISIYRENLALSNDAIAAANSPRTRRSSSGGGYGGGSSSGYYQPPPYVPPPSCQDPGVAWGSGNMTPSSPRC
jgi:hypothetical protein